MTSGQGPRETSISPRLEDDASRLVRGIRKGQSCRMNRVRRFPWPGLGSKFAVADILRGLALPPRHFITRLSPQLLYSAPRCQARLSWPQLCSPCSKSAPRPFLCSAVVIPSSQPRTKPVLPRTGVVKDGAATAKGGLSLTAPSTEACWMPAGTAEVFRCRSQGLASLRDGHGGPPSMG